MHRIKLFCFLYLFLAPRISNLSNLIFNPLSYYVNIPLFIIAQNGICKSTYIFNIIQAAVEPLCIAVSRRVAGLS